MEIHNIKTGSYFTNCYIVYCNETKEAAVIDPGDDGEEITGFINDNNLKVKYIINTHGHWDHIGALGYVKEKTKADILIHEDDEDTLQDADKNLSSYMSKPGTAPGADKLLKEGDKIKIGNNIILEVLHTPGHTQGSICLLGDGVFFSGDTVFADSIGRTDLPGGSYEEIKNSIHEKIVPLTNDYTIYPGHGSETTLSREKKLNPYFKRWDR